MNELKEKEAVQSAQAHRQRQEAFVLRQMSVAGNRRILSHILKIASLMLAAGAEVNRIEDTVMRLGAAYGFEQVDVFTVTSSIFATVTDAGGNTFTQISRVRSTETDMERVMQCNALSRRICRNPLPEKELLVEIKKLSETKRYDSAWNYASYALIAGSMAVFFGGDFPDAFAAALCGLAVRFIFRLGMRAQLQNFVMYFLDALAVGLLIAFLLRIGIGQHYDKIAMGNIMLLISGNGLTTAVRDMINGDIMTGLMGLTAALIQAAAVALGFAAAATLF